MEIHKCVCHVFSCLPKDVKVRVSRMEFTSQSKVWHSRFLRLCLETHSPNAVFLDGPKQSPLVPALVDPEFFFDNSFKGGGAHPWRILYTKTESAYLMTFSQLRILYFSRMLRWWCLVGFLSRTFRACLQTLSILTISLHHTLHRKPGHQWRIKVTHFIECHYTK